MPDLNQLFLKADNLRNNGQVDQAVKAYLEIARLAEQSGQLADQARSLQLAGVSCRESLAEPHSIYYRDSLDYLSQAEKLFQQLNDRVSLGAVYRDFGITHYHAGSFDQAAQFLSKSIELLTNEGDLANLAISYDKLGLLHYYQADYRVAEEQMEKALALFRQTTEPGFFHATTLLDHARVLIKLAQFDQAKNQAEEALSWFLADHNQHQFKRRIAELYGVLFVVSSKLNDGSAVKANWQRYQASIKGMDPLAAQVLNNDLEKLAS